jgi:hypothetical protein
MPLELNGTTGVQGNSGAFVAGTAVASTSGTSIDFTSIPSWVKRVTVMFDGVSTNGTSPILIQVGDSGGVETSGYVSRAERAGESTASTDGFILNSSSNATATYQGAIVLANLNAATFTWVANGNLNSTVQNNVMTSAGSKSLSATLDRVRITTVNGTDTFDAGSINILFE